MNNSRLELARMFLIVLVGFISSVIIATNKGNTHTMESYKIIDGYCNFILQLAEI